MLLIACALLGGVFIIPSKTAGEESRKAAILLNVVGDIMLAGEPQDPFGEVLGILQEADLNFANLEAPLTTEGKPARGKKFTFQVPPAMVETLASARFSLLSLANNHIMDYGVVGLRNTRQALREKGIAFAGAGETLGEARRPAVVVIRGKKVGLLAYSVTLPEEFYATPSSPGTAFAKEEYVAHDIPAARHDVDLLLVSFHWGEELKRDPKAYQMALAHRAIDLGADAVLGHHPHVYQSIEIYHGVPIFYSLGNFAFFPAGPSVTKGLLVRIVFEGRGAQAIELIPLNVSSREVGGRPRLLSEDDARQVIDDVKEISSRFGTQISFQKGRGVIAPLQLLTSSTEASGRRGEIKEE